DNIKLGALVRDGLGREGHIVDIAGSIARAEHVLKVFDYSLIILDLGLPDGSGLEFLHGMRRRRLQQPCLILTALDGLNDRVRGLNSGADDYLGKPFAMAELSARVNALYRRAFVKEYEKLGHQNLILDIQSHRVAIDG